MEKSKQILTKTNRLYTKIINDHDVNDLMSVYINDSYDDFDSIQAAFNKDKKINEKKLHDIIKLRIKGYKEIKLSSKNKFSRVLVYKADTNEPIGMIGFDSMDVEKNLNPISKNSEEYDTSNKAIVLIYKINSLHWNNGYGTEACGSMLKWFFEKLTHKQILANIYMNNYPSIRVVEKLGFEKIYEYQYNTNGPCNAYSFGLKKENLIVK